MNKFRAVILLSLLSLLIVVARITSQAGVAVFAVSRAQTGDADTRRDLLALMLAYPDHITGVEKDADGLIFVLASSGEKIVYDDGRVKSFEQKLADADLEDMMAQPYPLDMISTVPEGHTDPGRIRCYALLRTVYGSTQRDVEASLRRVSLGSRLFPFNCSNGAADALEAAFADVAALIAAAPEVSGFVYPLSGTYNYRVIAGTHSLSPHAFGIAADLASHPCDYWRWASREQGQTRLDAYPPALVRVFEDHGFIWGGKWAHFDFLHVEYRPELLIKARADAQAGTGGVWHTGFPDDENTCALIRLIDAALD
jgi:hypothetical protein